MSMLFSLRARPGEEYSSDSQDSDYFPGRQSSDDDIENVQRTRKKHTKRSKKAKLEISRPLKPKHRTKRKSAAINSTSFGSDSQLENSRLCLPPEVMVKIFKYGIQAEGVIHFISRVARVSHEWNRIATDPCMFEHLDFSIDRVMLTKKNQALLKRFLKHDISQCHHLSFHDQIHLNSSVIEHILNLTPHLKAIDLYGCVVKPELVKQMPQFCPKLRKINLSSPPGSSRKSSIVSVKALIEGIGANLVELRLSNCSVVMQYLSQVMKVIEDNCPALEELDLGVAGLGMASQANNNWTIDMEGLARGCPKLRELRLDGFNIVDEAWSQEPFRNGFRHLQMYSQSMHMHYLRDAPAFYRMFGSVKKLKVLNISHSRLLPSMISPWVKEVEELYLHDMRWMESEEHDLTLCVAAWLMSLRLLDISYNKPCGSIIDVALFQYGKTDNPNGYPLQVLNLSNSNITPRGVVHAIKSCQNLEEINLTSCRELPRGTKREFRREEFGYLLKSLRPFVEDHSHNGEDSAFSSYSDSD